MFWHVFGSDCYLQTHQKFQGTLLKQIGRIKNIKILADFVQVHNLIQVDCEQLQTGTRYRRLGNGVANCIYSRARILHFVNFGPQTEKNRTKVLTQPTLPNPGGHRAGLCHTLAFVQCLTCKEHLIQLQVA